MGCVRSSDLVDMWSTTHNGVHLERCSSQIVDLIRESQQPRTLKNSSQFLGALHHSISLHCFVSSDRHGMVCSSPRTFIKVVNTEETEVDSSFQANMAFKTWVRTIKETQPLVCLEYERNAEMRLGAQRHLTRIHKVMGINNK